MRHVGESIIVGDDVKVVILGIDVNKVKVGVIAPSDTSVHRSEVYARIKSGEK
jgi:carbon storage regulator